MFLNWRNILFIAFQKNLKYYLFKKKEKKNLIQSFQIQNNFPKASSKYFYYFALKQQSTFSKCDLHQSNELHENMNFRTEMQKSTF